LACRLQWEIYCIVGGRGMVGFDIKWWQPRPVVNLPCHCLGGCWQLHDGTRWCKGCEVIVLHHFGWLIWDDKTVGGCIGLVIEVVVGRGQG